MPGYKYDPKNPRTVSELSDASALFGLASALDKNLDALETAGARKSVMHARQILLSTANELRP